MLQVPYSHHGDWFWAHTSVAALGPGGSMQLKGVTLGEEWDIDPTAANISVPVDSPASDILADTLNGLAAYRPRNLRYLSDTTVSIPKGILIDSAGIGNVQDGLATHHLTLYRAVSGAWVFAAGISNWSGGLGWTGTQDTNPDVGQATVNFLETAGAHGAQHTGYVNPTA